MAQRDEKGRFVRTNPDYKAMYEAERKRFYQVSENVQYWNEEYKKTEEQRCFLLKHAGPILRWRYNRKFKKGE